MDLDLVSRSWWGFVLFLIDIVVGMCLGGGTSRPSCEIEGGEGACVYVCM